MTSSHDLHCDVLVVGAGPAGSAAATALARAGIDTLLVDRSEFPRDKVCGDGLIPDAFAALRRLGVLDQVMAAAQRARHLGCIGPRGGRIDVPGTLAVLPRRELDLIVQRNALASGARWLAPARYEAPLLDARERVVGARLGTREGAVQVHARWTVLATGAVPQALIAAGLCRRRTPSGVAMRGYVKNDAMVGRIQALDVIWHKRLRKGYGWVFPCRDGVFNIGVGLAHSHAKGHDGRASMAEVNLREMLDTFCEVHAPAGELVRGGQWLGELKGAPLRCSLDGATSSRDGLLVTGEAMGSTYAFTGEGIGKAMETGLLAAESLQAGMDDVAVRARYDAALATLKPRFDLYERANRINEYPFLADLLIWRARHSPRLLKRMQGVLDETNNPGHFVSVRGLLRLFLPIS